MTPEEVLAAGEAWVWWPEGAPVVETDEYLLVRLPDWFEHPSELLRFRPERDAAVVVDEILDRARAFGVDRMVAWVRPSAAPDLERLLRERGGREHEVLDVLALDLVDGAPDLDPPSRLSLRWALDADVLRDSERVSVAVFGGEMPPEEEQTAMLGRYRRTAERGGGGIVVAYDDDRPVGFGGLSVVDGVARLWGGAVLEEARGRGVYRAVLAERIRYGVDQGSSMALVKGRVATSGPILRRAGFTAYGQERSYLMPL